MRMTYTAELMTFTISGFVYKEMVFAFKRRQRLCENGAALDKQIRRGGRLRIQAAITRSRLIITGRAALRSKNMPMYFSRGQILPGS